MSVEMEVANLQTVNIGGQRYVKVKVEIEAMADKVVEKTARVAVSLFVLYAKMLDVAFLFDAETSLFTSFLGNFGHNRAILAYICFNQFLVCHKVSSVLGWMVDLQWEQWHQERESGVFLMRSPVCTPQSASLKRCISGPY